MSRHEDMAEVIDRLEAEDSRARRLEYRPLDSLTPDPANPKAHDRTLIESSVGRFGYIEPIVEDGRTGRLVSGHGRVAALLTMRERGDAPPEGVSLDPDSGEWTVPVVTGWSSRTDAEARAALVALNRTTELGGWVDEALLDVLDQLAADDGLLGVGYDDSSIDLLREQVEAAATQGMMDGLTDGADNPYTKSGTWGGDDSVGLTFPMTADQRTAVLARINSHREGSGLGTRTEALLDLLGVTE